MTATARAYASTAPGARVAYRTPRIDGQRPVPRVAVQIECDWAAQAAAHAIRGVGADPVILTRRSADTSGSPADTPLVYDLSPWDASAIAFLRQRAALLGNTPTLLYLPPTGAAFAALTHVPKSEYSALQIQARDGNSLRHLRDATDTLVKDLPRVRVMRQLLASVGDLSGVARLFAHRALRILGAGQRPTVRAIARGLRMSPRTLQRRFAADRLPSPKALLDWLTLAHVETIADMHDLTAARAASRAGLTSNDLYRLRKRGVRADPLSAGASVHPSNRN